MVEMNITTVTFPCPGAITTWLPCRSVRVKSATSPPIRNSCPAAAILNSSARPSGTRILLLAFDFQIDNRLLAGVERAQGPRWARRALVFGFERVIHVRIQAVKLIGAILLRDKRPHLQCLGV